MKQFSSETQKIGKVGEDLACRHLLNKGFAIKERNYTQKWGEIDIIAEKEGELHFIEVKSVSRENLEDMVTRENIYRPEENVHPKKRERMERTIQTYLAEHHIPEQVDFVIDVVAVYIDFHTKRARIEILENVIL